MTQSCAAEFIAHFLHVFFAVGKSHTERALNHGSYESHMLAIVFIADKASKINIVANLYKVGIKIKHL